MGDATSRAERDEPGAQVESLVAGRLGAGGGHAPDCAMLETVSDAQTAKRRVRRAVDPLADFLHDEAAGGVALVVAAVAALVWINAR